MFDYPIFEFPMLGLRMLFAIDAITHVFVSHGAAVGGSIILVLLQYLAIKKNDEKLDELSRKILFTFFILATAVGALTGIGIWIHINVVNPAAIGSLIRVFFWKWFIEWIVFNIEMILLLWWFLTWKKNNLGTEEKKKSFRIGVSYAISSWFTMAIITAILGFMMTPGKWLVTEFPTKPDYMASLMNPSWIPSLGFRTFFSIIWASALAILMTSFFASKDDELRDRVTKLLVKVIGFCTIPTVLFGYWYYQQFPEAAKKLFVIGVITRRLADHPEWASYAVLAFVFLALLSCLLMFARTRKQTNALAIILFISCATLIGTFERVREFVRKPYVIYGYMYANGVRVIDLPYLKKEGFLKTSAFVPPEYKTITEENKLKAGEYLFKLQCRYCHTVDGVNSIQARTKGWSEDAIYTRLEKLNSPVTPFMPPFAGTDEERRAISKYISSLAN